jgi:hypothetical protein
MTTGTQTITGFLESRIAEVEAAARAASEVEGAAEMLAALPTPLFDGLRVAFPARVLAECEAKRRIVDEHRPFRLAQTVCQRCEERGQIGYEDMVVEWPCPTLRALASVYANHPDFRQEWA